MSLPRILIVDDAAGTALLFCKMLSGIGECVPLASGELALAEYHRAREAGQPYDLLLLDLAMPGISGFQIAEAVRAGGDEQTRVVFLTAYHDPEIASRAWSLGVTEIWNKPILPEELEEKVRGIMSLE